MALSNSNHFKTDFCLLLANQVLEEKLAAKEGSNFLVSPLSLHVILSLVAAASRGHTLDQLLFFLGSTSVPHLSLLTSHIISLTNFPDHDQESEELSTVNHPLLSFVYGAWIDQKFNLKPSFKGLVKNSYKAEIRNDVDFVNKPNEAVDKVNSWVEKATKGLINKLLPYDSVDELTAVVLANALYFKGPWDRIFDASRTQTRNFHLLNGQIVQAPFMSTSDDFLGRYHLYKCFDDFKVLQLPYKTGQYSRKFSMYFFLPDAKDGLLNLIQKIKSNTDLLYQQFEMTKDKLTEFWIPKFKFSFEFEASDTMKKMGLEKIFEPGELTEIIDHPFAGAELFISYIFHKAYIEVNEEGTETAASTAAIFEMQQLRNYPSFVADHPFLFMIREETRGIVFFVGAVLNPLLES